MEGKMRRFLVGAVLAAVIHTSAAAQAGRVIGRVTDGVGNAVRDARVVLVAADSSAESSAGVRRETTGETGGFEFARVDPGSYTLRVERAGYRRHEVRVDLRPGGRELLVARLGTERRRAAVIEQARSTTDVRPRP
jgi:protocatechuate 3,4-dioxygenase beta subunit